MMPTVNRQHLRGLAARARMAAALVVVAMAGTAAAQSADDGPIVVGAVATSGHPAHADAADLALVVAAAAERVLDAGHELAGRAVRIVPVEDECSRSGAEEAARRLVAAGARAVIGHVCAGAAMAAAPIYAAAGVLLIVPGARHPRLTAEPSQPLVLRLAGRSDRQGQAIARLAAERHAGRRLAIVHDRSAEARSLADAVEKALSPQKPVLRLDFASGEKSYRDVAERIARSDADLLVSPAQPVELGLILDALAALGRRPPVIAGETHAVPDLEPVAARHGDQITLLLPWPAGTAAGAAPNRLAMAALEAWVGAVRRARSADPRLVAHALAEHPEPTVAGPVRFDADGDAVVPSHVPHRWDGVRWRPDAR